MKRFRISLSTGGTIAAIFVGQALGMAEIVSDLAAFSPFRRCRDSAPPP
jgi:hypothetical protein